MKITRIDLGVEVTNMGGCAYIHTHMHMVRYVTFPMVI